MSNAQCIRADGFKNSSSGQLGSGVYFAEDDNVDKAKRFAHDFALRKSNDGSEPALLECVVLIRNPKFVGESANAGRWTEQGHDAVRCDRTAASTGPEWCIKDPDMVQRIVDVTGLSEARQPPASHNFRRIPV
eukprot:gene57649-biopygen32577